MKLILMTDKAIVIVAWVVSLAWFLLATWAAMGFTPFSFVAWAIPASVLLKRSAKWWRDGGDPAYTVVYRCVHWGLWALVVIVLMLAGVLASTPAMASRRTPVDTATESVAATCLLFPPLVAGWAVWRTARVATRASAL
jgi:hypothetical protein